MPLAALQNNIKTEMVERYCLTCGISLVLKIKRDQKRKKFCSHSCKSKNSKLSHRMIHIKRISKRCVMCDSLFGSISKVNIFCNKKCQLKASYKRVKNQYSKNTLEDHLFRLRIKGNSRNLSEEFLISLYQKQNGLCALSGVPMTWILGQGRIPTNISIDRIDSTQDYEESNIQLVCVTVNIMKQRFSNKEFIAWCKIIGDHSNS